MIDRLEAINSKYQEITNELSNPEVISNINKMTELSKEHRSLTPPHFYNIYSCLFV